MVQTIVKKLKKIILKLGLLNLFKNNSKKSNYINCRIDDEFHNRILDVLRCNNWEKIQFKPNAGLVDWPLQYMHNGLKIYAGSYYNHSFTKLFEVTKGVHEPQEEYAFQQVLPFIPNNGVMIELGAYWAFYSMWFKKVKPMGECYLIEPFLTALQYGKENAKINNLKLNFFNYIIGREVKNIELGFDTNNMINIDYFAKINEIKFIDLLHSDIQGFEFDMLNGAGQLLKFKKIGFLFVSTHSNDIHQNCLDYIKTFDYEILVDCNLDQSFCHDGIIVAKAIGYSSLESIDIHKK